MSDTLSISTTYSTLAITRTPHCGGAEFREQHLQLSAAVPTVAILMRMLTELCSAGPLTVEQESFPDLFTIHRYLLADSALAKVIPCLP